MKHFQNHQIVLVLDSKYFLTFPILDFHKKREGGYPSLFLFKNHFIRILDKRWFRNIHKYFTKSKGIKWHKSSILDKMGRF